MEITTNTIAELYIKQGYPEKAADIYKAILELDPGNAAAKGRLAAIEAEMAAAAAPVEESISFEEPLVTEVQAPVAAAPSFGSQAAPVANDADAQAARLEEWLSAIRRVGRRA